MARIDDPSVLLFGQELIPDSDIYELGSEKHGREMKPHVTIKYGLHTNEIDDVLPVLDGCSCFDVTFGNTAIFEQDDYDVVIIAIDSDTLRELNQKICDNLEWTDKHDYKPHMTLAYVNKGCGKQYADNGAMNGKKARISDLEFSPAEGLNSIITL